MDQFASITPEPMPAASAAASPANQPVDRKLILMGIFSMIFVLLIGFVGMFLYFQNKNNNLASEQSTNYIQGENGSDLVTQEQLNANNGGAAAVKVSNTPVPAATTKPTSTAQAKTTDPSKAPATTTTAAPTPGLGMYHPESTPTADTCFTYKYTQGTVGFPKGTDLTEIAKRCPIYLKKDVPTSNLRYTEYDISIAYSQNDNNNNAIYFELLKTMPETIFSGNAVIGYNPDNPNSSGSTGGTLYKVTDTKVMVDINGRTAYGVLMKEYTCAENTEDETKCKDKNNPKLLLEVDGGIWLTAYQYAGDRFLHKTDLSSKPVLYLNRVK